MEWWSRMLSPVRRVWIRLATRLRTRRSGLRQLRREVSTCEYEDVHVMWEMLRKSEFAAAAAATTTVLAEKKRPTARRSHAWAAGVLDWAPLGLCRTF
ncbi:uncharacterized protein M6B38_253455 [Iris pallida]|uniref:Uncharacterized protein n=1 Tax=Iris pallida TaxID=29817 RepID=A0AAX6IIA5_IRIPA|nr:uncharacterized protein M6B38_253455 [Iris pallida]